MVNVNGVFDAATECLTTECLTTECLTTECLTTECLMRMSAKATGCLISFECLIGFFAQ
jgi:hypothetical protein